MLRILRGFKNTRLNLQQASARASFHHEQPSKNRRIFPEALPQQSPRVGWMDEKDRPNHAILYSCLAIVVGCSLYGFSVGLWRSPLQGLYSAIKLPLLIFLVCLANSLLNSILAMVLNSRLSFRQIAFCVLFSFALFSLIVGAISPVSLFLTLNTPNPMSGSAAKFTALVWSSTPASLPTPAFLEIGNSTSFWCC